MCKCFVSFRKFDQERLKFMIHILQMGDLAAVAKSEKGTTMHYQMNFKEKQTQDLEAPI